MSREHPEGKDKYRPKHADSGTKSGESTAVVGLVVGDGSGGGLGGGEREPSSPEGHVVGIHVKDQQIVYSPDGKHTVDVTLGWFPSHGAEGYEIRVSKLGWGDD